MNKTIQFRRARCVLMTGHDTGCQGCDYTGCCITLHPELGEMLRTVFYTKALKKRKHIKDTPELRQLISKYPDAVKVV